MRTESQEQLLPTTVFKDNTQVALLSATDKINLKTKHIRHIDLKFHHVRSLVKERVVSIVHVKTDSQKADILTKRLGAVKFLKFAQCSLESNVVTVLE